MHDNDLLILLGTILAGAVVGSFLNMLITRLPLIFAEHDLDPDPPLSNKVITAISVPNSHCPICKKTLGLKMLIPIFSFLWQKGKCAHCKNAISRRYLLVEICAVFIGISLAITQFEVHLSLYLALFFSICLVLSAIDIETQTLPDELTLPLLWLGLLINLSETFVSIHDAVLGAIFGYVFLWLIYQIYYLIRKKEGLGFGDFKILAAVGAWFGWQSLPTVLFIAVILTLIFSLWAILRKRMTAETPIAFGPFISLATFLFVMSPTDTWWTSFIP